MTTIPVGNKRIGAGAPCFLVAEIGINHNGDMSLAEEAIDAAAAVGADAVKFQNYRTEDFVLDRELTYEYVSSGETVVESQFDMFKRCELSADDLMRLAQYAGERDIVFFSTPTGVDGIEALVELGVPLLKNGSDYLQHLPLIEAMARTGIPTVLSTGMANLSEVDDAVRAFRGAGGEELVLLHCTSSYPTPPSDVHLRKISTYQCAFGCSVGLSDHTEGVVAAVGAVMLGACMIEKHFTLDKTLPGPDHRFSADSEEFDRLVREVRTVEAMLGEETIGPTPSEEQAREAFRLSCLAAREMQAGERIGRDDVLISRPGTGLPPTAKELLIGRKTKRHVRRGSPLTLDDVV